MAYCRLRARFQRNWCWHNQGFTRFDAAAVFGAVMLLVVISLPLLANTSRQSVQLACLNNLRQIGIGFQHWGAEHEDRRPWFVPMSEGGTYDHPLRQNPYLHYTVLSNYVSAHVVFDPADPTKRMPTRWDFHPEGGFQNGRYANNAVSYMLGGHCFASLSSDVLAADRYVFVERFTACAVGWTRVAVVSPELSFRGWTNGPHGVSGNLLFNDGRVEATSNNRFKEAASQADPDVGAAFHFLIP